MNIQERIERSFYEKVRLRVVADGYSPDITTYPQGSAGFHQYEADLAHILATKDFGVEVYGMSNPEAKGYKKLARVVFITDSFIPGDFGLEETYFYEKKVDGDFQSEKSSQNLSHILYLKCHIVCDTVVQFRYLSNVINSALPLRGFIPYFDSATKEFFTEVISYMDISNATNGILEKVYSYSIPDIIWTEPIVDPESTVPIQHINLKIMQKLGLIETWIPDAPPATGPPVYVLTTNKQEFLKTHDDKLISVLHN